MKKIFFITLVLTCLFSFGKCNKHKKCSKKKATTETSSVKLNVNETWMRYDETKCDNPWQFNWLVKPTAEQVIGAVKGDLMGREINILEIRASGETGLISCDTCICPDGVHYFVRVPKTNIV